KHDGEIIRRVFLHQLAQHVGKQVGHLGRNSLRAVEPPHWGKEGAEDESHRVDEEEFVRGRGFCHRGEYSKAARAAGVCYFIGSRFSRVLTSSHAQTRQRQYGGGYRRSGSARLEAA